MIEIIRHGSKRTTTCGKCECIFSFEEEDIKTVHTGMNEFENEVICPECGERVNACNMAPKGKSAVRE